MMIIWIRHNNINSILTISLLLFSLIILEGCKKETPHYCYVMAPRGVNLRSEASIKAKVVTLLPYKARLLRLSTEKINETIDTLEGHWIQVSYKDQKGWIFDPYTSAYIPKASTPDSLKSLKDLISNLTSKRIKINNNYFEFGLSPEEILKRFGEPTEISNGSGFGYFDYTNCFICFDDFFVGKTLKNYKIRSYKHDYKTHGLHLFPDKEISLDDLVHMQKQKLKVDYNGHDLLWDIQLKIHHYNLTFQLTSLNSNIETIKLRGKKKTY